MAFEALVKNTAVLAERYYFAFYAFCRLMPVVIICLFVAFAYADRRMLETFTVSAVSSRTIVALFF